MTEFMVTHKYMRTFLWWYRARIHRYSRIPSQTWNTNTIECAPFISYWILWTKKAILFHSRAPIVSMIVWKLCLCFAVLGITMCSAKCKEDAKKKKKLMSWIIVAPCFYRTTWTLFKICMITDNLINHLLKSTFDESILIIFMKVCKDKFKTLFW